MGKHFQQAPGLLRLDETAQAALRKLRDSAPVPYLRERAAALLKVAAGEPVRDVAQTGLLRPRQPDTVYDWLDRYRAAGVAGVTIRPGRGRKPAFSPVGAEVVTAEQASCAQGVGG